MGANQGTVRRHGHRRQELGLHSAGDGETPRKSQPGNVARFAF